MPNSGRGVAESVHGSSNAMHLYEFSLLDLAIAVGMILLGWVILVMWLRGRQP